MLVTRTAARPLRLRAERAGRQKGARLGHGCGRAAAETESQPGEVERCPCPPRGAARVRLPLHPERRPHPDRPEGAGALEDRIRELASRRWSIAMDERMAKANRFTTGWMGYFQLLDAPRPFRDRDEWLRRRTRQIRRKEGKRPETRHANLLRLGINEHFSSKWEYSGKGYRWIAGSPVLQRALPNSYWEDLSLHMLKPTWQRLRSAR
ncbi:group II intron maturase-specific domain-containing protein [Streptomyces pinistramenti]|uniref:group II intron maturase-specific domain-containing protein n=1 Tax=Streptomyces pinistramenti TaxID=2884812 RepID=UPI001D0907CA|nr:group II intron maturase-specific domain-containing protein [Streptomyces pinistramenti]MCB5906396.1 hypothetical protein [Streptomyces pinistramenti]